MSKVSSYGQSNIDISVLENDKQKKLDVIISLLAVGLFFVILGGLLMLNSLSASVFSQGYGFVPHLLGLNMLSIGVMVSASCALSIIFSLYSIYRQNYGGFSLNDAIGI